MIQYFTQKNSPGVFDPDCMPVLEYISILDHNTNKNWPRVFHRHADVAEILIVFAGHGRYQIAENVYMISEGDFILCNAGVVHGDHPEDCKKLETFCLAFSNMRLLGLGVGEIIPAASKPILSLKDEMPRIIPLCREVEHLIKREDPAFTEVARHLAWALLAHVVLRSRDADEALFELQHAKYRLVREIRDYIDKHLFEDFNLAQIAANLYVSPYYLSHVYKDITGKSIFNYVQTRRIGEGQSLLIETDLPITEIALRVGFSSSSSFSNTFSKMMGVSPTDFRKKYVKKDI